MTHIKRSVLISSGFVLLLWLILLIDIAFSLNAYRWSILPGQLSGLKGVLFGPLIHGSTQHLLSNTLPLLLLGTIMLYGNINTRWWVLAIIWCVSGLGVWCFARNSYHFGASGLTHGLFYYLCLVGLLRRDMRSVVLLMIAFYMYGSMLTTIFPGERGVSFEYHLFGAIGGIMSAILFRDADRIASKTYSWQHTDEDDEDPIIGDQWKL